VRVVVLRALAELSDWLFFLLFHAEDCEGRCSIDAGEVLWPVFILVLPQRHGGHRVL